MESFHVLFAMKESKQVSVVLARTATLFHPEYKLGQGLQEMKP